MERLSRKVQGTVQVDPRKIYVKVADYGGVFLLTSVRISPGVPIWFWSRMNPRSEIVHDISEFVSMVTPLVQGSFDYVLNSGVMDIYSSVYSFDNFSEFCENIEKAVYLDDPDSGKYKSSDKI